MHRVLIAVLACLACVPSLRSAPKKHVISFGQPLPVKLFVGPAEDKSLDLKVRALYVDGRLREFTTGEAHDITDQVFVVRRAYRLNDALPDDGKTPPKWRWQRGGWLTVDRGSGRVSQLSLPEFDPYYSVASWYRDYAAYCGVSDSGEKLYAVVAQVGRKKPVLRRELGAASNSEMPDSECPAPLWQRQPVRVTFRPRSGDTLTFSIRGHAADVAMGDEAEEQ